MRRDNSTESAALARLNSQLPLASKLEYSDHVIDNSGSLTDLEEQVSALVLRFNKDAGWTWVLNWLLPPVGIVMGIWRLSYKMIRRRRRRGVRNSGPPPDGGIRLED